MIVRNNPNLQRRAAGVSLRSLKIDLSHGIILPSRSKSSASAMKKDARPQSKKRSSLGSKRAQPLSQKNSASAEQEMGTASLLYRNEAQAWDVIIFPHSGLCFDSEVHFAWSFFTVSLQIKLSYVAPLHLPFRMLLSRGASSHFTPYQALAWYASLDFF